MIIILKEIIKTTDELGIKYLTVFAFSTENWYRPKEEVSYYGNLHIRNLHIQMRYGLIEEGRLQHFAGMKYYFSMKGKVYDRYEQEGPKCIMYY